MGSTDLSSLEMLEGLHKGALDVVVTVPPSKGAADVAWITVQQQSWRVAVPRQHALAGRKALTPQDLHDQRLVVYNQREYPDYWASLSIWFQNQGISARIASECDGVTSLISAVEAGLGIALVVERIACLIPERIDLKPLKPQPDPVCIAAGRLESRSRDKVVAVFVEELKRAGAVEGGRR